MKIDDRLLFLKYALPCASTLVKRGTTTQEIVDDLISKVSKGTLPEEGKEDMFVVANAMCRSIAKRMGKASIDPEVIRQYFLIEHNKVVDERFELMKDFNPIDCKTYPGRIIEVGDGTAVVETALGKSKYKTVFANGVKIGDLVVVHFDFIIEKISKEIADKMKAGAKNAK